MKHLTRTLLVTFAVVLFSSARVNADVTGIIDGIC
jgi:hypothetical protein